MSHPETQHIVCPNCGFEISRNYCAQCGQETHLHKDTFGALFMHFIGHYFHYDSKFWQTIKALVLSPGKLTTAYWNKQRARYLPPITLYLFISAVAFLALSTIASNDKGPVRKTSIEVHENDTIVHENVAYQSSSTVRSLTHSFRNNLDAMENNEEGMDKLGEKVAHNFPKVFFFMIPLMAVILKVFFTGRKELYFVNHIIFSLHYHSFLFLFLIVEALIFYFIKGHDGFEMLLIFSAISLYLIIALVNVYGVNWIKAFFITLFTEVLYIIVLLILTVGITAWLSKNIS